MRESHAAQTISQSRLPILLRKVDKSTISIGIALGAFLISLVSLLVSILGYRKDRWKLSLEAWIEPSKSSPPFFEGSIRGRLFVKAANIGRRALTIEQIHLQVFEDEVEELRKNEHVWTGKKERRGAVASFPYTRPRGFPVQLDENEPMTAEMSLLGIDSANLESRNRRCIVYVTGRRKLIKIRLGLAGDSLPRKVRYFSGS
jgi:hypothetical protein